MSADFFSGLLDVRFARKRTFLAGRCRPRITLDSRLLRIELSAGLQIADDDLAVRVEDLQHIGGFRAISRQSRWVRTVPSTDHYLPPGSSASSTARLWSACLQLVAPLSRSIGPLIDAASLGERDAIIDDLKKSNGLRLPFDRIALKFPQEKVAEVLGWTIFPTYRHVCLTMAVGGEPQRMVP